MDVLHRGPKQSSVRSWRRTSVTSQGELLGDAVPHQPGADDRDPLDPCKVHDPPGLIARLAQSISDSTQVGSLTDEPGEVYRLPAETSLPVFLSQRTVRTASRCSPWQLVQTRLFSLV